MSETTVNSTVTGIIGTVESILPIVLAGKLVGLNTTIHADLAKLGADADAKIASLKAALDTFETSNPLAQQIVTGVLAVAKGAGLVLPTEAQVFLALKSIVDTAFSIAQPAPVAA